ncbi:MAG: PilT/PilU family type 4a pilus ATPase [Myxococcales bacterium]|nr:PilT/PilU family type 4a pilus ATPase [Myxococcales bacterium]MCB9519793.1 PilT/PilU family type 4a pilus ATPase [Myxococcales bacterium]
MIEHPIEGDFRQWVVNAFRQSPLFSTLDARAIEKVMGMARLHEYEPDELLAREGEPSDTFWVVLMGEATAFVTDPLSGERIETGRLRANDSVGEVGMILESPRTAGVSCVKQTYALQFDRAGFDYLLERIPGFARRLSRTVADRLVQQNLKATFPPVLREEMRPTPELVRMIPKEAVIRFRLLPVARTADTVLVGFVDPPTQDLVARVRASLGDLKLRIGILSMRDFDALSESFNLKPDPPAPVAAVAAQPAERGGATLAMPAAMAVAAAAAGAAAPVAQLPLREPAKLHRELRQDSGTHTSMVAKLEQFARIRPILERMPEVNASDLHLSGLQKPRWRIDGELYEISEFSVLEEEEVLDLFEPVMPTKAIEEFNAHFDCDFAFNVDGLARFRANVFRDDNGVGAVLRIIPMHVPPMEALGLPAAARGFCQLHQGLVLVCGPTGSGKSTTLAAMIDHINASRRVHIVTLEDPIEYVHSSKAGMVTQREVGKNTPSFARGLRASLREDPDIVLVGELRDLETLELALQTAQTGHLVFGTLHTSTAIGTIDRIIDVFPADQHSQVRSTLADVLRGVIAQQLCKRIGGGRVAAFECLVGGSAVANCVRQAKTLNISTIMTTNRSEGHRMLNDELHELVRTRQIEPLEALNHSDDKKDLRVRLGMASPST